jgi:hypothetical protein
VPAGARAPVRQLLHAPVHRARDGGPRSHMPRLLPLFPRRRLRRVGHLRTRGVRLDGADGSGAVAWRWADSLLPCCCREATQTTAAAAVPLLQAVSLHVLRMSGARMRAAACWASFT